MRLTMKVTAVAGSSERWQVSEGQQERERFSPSLFSQPVITAVMQATY